ncbi:hypothetical protein DPMN_150964 [Dreissena polymorpha]|uniref:Uncharacterized protein n=1 Tax=Dreissena polymorpha TaxID=45954 RepID=A0A9D4FGP6_DREPO|nr:hypothetical protein DPMN_150964 [Dreissena polymorpha]
MKSPVQSDSVTGKVKHGATWGKKSKMSSTDEKALIEIATIQAARGLGFTNGNILRYVGIFADQKGASFKRDRRSDMWWRKLKARNPEFSLQSPEAPAANRHTAMTCNAPKGKKSRTHV